jgi:micrococcal nuclease
MFDCIFKYRLRRLNLNNTEKFKPNIRLAKVIKVYDGDTITIGTIMNNNNYQFQVRLNRLDTPELKTKNEIEKKAGLFVRDKLIEKILYQVITINIIEYDKYGRLLAEIYLNDENINDWLLNNKFAVPYNGKTKEIVDWSYLN